MHSAYQIILCVIGGTFAFLSLVSAKGPIVETPLGMVQGFLGRSYCNRTFTNFYSIPYAKPPVGQLRFKEPQPPLPWKGIWKANFSTSCPQYLPEYSGDEDCLYLNIFVPSSNPASINKRLPVIVDIHAGSFMYGHSSSYSGPAYIMDRDVILVTINYRIGALGFLSTEDDIVPGNNGLKDQVQALKWVKNYIRHFGGDNTQVTIMGLSAGGSSVSYHYLSPMSKGLFKNGISISGVHLNPWSLQEAPLEKAKKLANACGCNQNSTKDFMECLRTRTAKQIVEETKKNMYIWFGNPFSPFGPVVEKVSNEIEQVFLSETPFKAISSGRINDVPWMVTITVDEALSLTAEWLNEEEYLPYVEANWRQLCPYLFDFNYTIPNSQKSDICDKIKNFYMNNKPMDREHVLKLTKALTDRLFGVGIEMSAKLQARVNKSPVYVYRYNYTAEKMNSFAVFFSNQPKQGVCHGDDMMMIFSQFHRGFADTGMSINDKKIQDLLLDLFLSFAETGIPSSGHINWKPVQKAGGLKYLHINSPTSIGMRESYTISNVDFWKQFNFKENENI